jgi:hypothetical protein
MSPAKSTKRNNKLSPFHLGFLYLHPTDPVFWALLSSLFQVTGKEEDMDQRGVAARGVGSDCGHC